MQKPWPLLSRVAKGKGPVGPPPESDLEVRVDVHDLSRVEWTVSVLMPAQRARKYQVEFAIELPSNLYTAQNVWEPLQTYTRLQSPSEIGQVQIERDDIDELRRDTLGIAHRLKQQRYKFERLCKDAATALIEALHPSLEGKLREVV